GVALLATHESRLAALSSLAIWAAAAFAAAVVAFVLALIIHHSPRIAHNLAEVSSRYFAPRAALPLGLLIFALPFAFGLGPFWAALCWAALVFPYASKGERWALGVALGLLGLIAPVAAVVARENIVERSPLYVAAVDLEEQREDASAEDGLRRRHPGLRSGRLAGSGSGGGVLQPLHRARRGLRLRRPGRRDGEGSRDFR